MSEQEELKAKLQEAQQRDLEVCRAEIDAILKQHKAALVGVPQFAPNGDGWQIVVNVGVVPSGG